MRESFETTLLLDDEGRAYAAFAKADFCSEHEQGIGGIHALMGCGSPDADGITRYTMSPDRFIEGTTFVLRREKFATRSEKGRKKTVDLEVLYGRAPYYDQGEVWVRRSSDDPFDAAFSERNFRLVGRTEAARAFLKSVADRAPSGDVAVFMGGGGGNPFDRGGLVISIPSLTPTSQLETLMDAHVSTRRLKEAAEATGIRERIEAAAKGAGDRRFHLYGLTPKWSEGFKFVRVEDHPGTEHSVVFWINDGRSVHGWYTVEELDEWIEGRGRVLTDEEAYQAERAARANRP